MSELYTKGQLTKLFKSLEEILNDKNIFNCNLLKSKLLKEIDFWRIYECRTQKQKVLIRKKVESLIKLGKLKIENNDIVLLD